MTIYCQWWQFQTTSKFCHVAVSTIDNQFKPIVNHKGTFAIWTSPFKLAQSKGSGEYVR